MVLLRRTALQSVAILGLALALGFILNELHPRGVRLSSRETQENSALGDSLVLAALADTTLVLPAPPRISTETVRRLLASGRAILVDARTPEEYERAHIPGSVNLPYEQLFEKIDVLGNIGPGTWVICYCDGPPCDLAELLAEELFAAGLRRVAIYWGGLKAWKQGGEGN